MSTHYELFMIITNGLRLYTQRPQGVGFSKKRGASKL